jgi:SAM-dependent methyltransferase
MGAAMIIANIAMCFNPSLWRKPRGILKAIAEACLYGSLVEFIFKLMEIKEIRSEAKPHFIGNRALYTFLRLAAFPLKFILSSRYRVEVLAHLKSSDNYLQRSPFTRYNRYPLLFAECKTYLSSITHPQILSFGCATGEEVFTLADLMPAAAITGVDINEWCLQQCRKKNISNECRFWHRSSTDFENADGFDAIFCMAVFQRTENRTQKKDTAAKGFGFDDFKREVQLLDSKLKPGGLLIIDHADFSFTDTACAGLYKPLGFEKNRLVRNRPLFNRDNQKVANMQNNYRVFVKTA